MSNVVLALLVHATGLSGSGPVLLVVDDLPWLDRASAIVLGVVARRLAASRVGFLAVSRSGEVASISGVTPLRTLVGFTHVTSCGQDHRPAERHPGQGQRADPSLRDRW